METTVAKSMRDQVSEYIQSLQNTIVSALENLDHTAPLFRRDSWVRPQGGKGISCVFAAPPALSFSNTQETVLEKAGVNISIIHGTLPPAALKQMRADHSSIPYDPDSSASLPFFAAGISLVIHPRNPMAPTVHANYRYFEITETSDSGDSSDRKVLAWWFGGGSDLTPSYLFEEDAAEFHGTLKAACDLHCAEFYDAFKQWCDEYFHIPHRNESRGIGGFFFDDLCAESHVRLAGDKETPHPKPRPRTQSELFSFMKTCGNSFIPSYIPILTRRSWSPFDEHNRRWQLLRRGRYVEFNLIYDRGTKFGLLTPDARIESILMSLPEIARWEYQTDMGSDEQSEEAKIVAVLRNPRAWV